MAVAGGIETARRTDKNCVNQKIGDVNYTACMSIYFQIPQYGLIGVSEVFAGVGGKWQSPEIKIWTFFVVHKIYSS